MIIYYFKLAIRNFGTNRLIFVGSILTLCLGTLCISLLYSYVHNEMTMDQFHKNIDDIYLMKIKASPEAQWEIINPALFFKFNYKEHPELRNYTNIQKYNEGEMKISYEDSEYTPEGIIVDTTFFEMFDFTMKVGDAKMALSAPNSILITERFAKKVFGSQNPVGKQLNVTSNRKDICTVAGIVNPPPSNSSITFDFILRSSSEPNKYSRSGGAFFLVNKGFDPSSFNKKIASIGHSHQQFGESIMGIQPFNTMYYSKNITELKGLISKYGDKKTLYILIGTMILILLISAINLSNLQIINANKTQKTNAISMINGARKRDIVYQKIIETALHIAISAVLISALYFLLLPGFNSITKVSLSPPFLNIFFLNTIILLCLSTLALIYPIFLAMRFPPITGMKNLYLSGSLIGGRNGFIVLQYALTFVLLIASVTVVKQLNSLLNKDLGFHKENILRAKLFHRIPYPLQQADFAKYRDNQAFLTAKSAEYREQKKQQERGYQVLKDKLESHTSIELFAQGKIPISPYTMPCKPKNKEIDYSSQNSLSVSVDYAKVFNIQIVEGRFFDSEKDKSRGNKVVINEAAKKYWNIQDIADTRLLNRYWNNDEGYEVIGVVKDFDYEHLSLKPKPLIMYFM